MRVYDYGHECETEELTQTLSALSPAQRRAVRSYVRHVEFEGMTLEDWLLTEDAPAKSTWNKPGGNYWGSNANPNHIFRAAVQEYTEAYTKWTLRAEQRQIRAAGGVMAGGLLKAAQRLVTLVDEGENDRIKLDAAKDLLNRFKDTASQAPASAQSESNELTDEERAAELRPYLTQRELDELNRLVESDRRIWRPLAGPQTTAFHSPADEIFYGGAAGGGKTDLLIGLALTAHRRSIIFRREYPQLKAIVDRCAEIIGEAGRYNVQSNTWRMRDGRLLELGAAQYEKDVRKYQGRPHDLKCFDELPNFTEYQYLFLSGWLRTTWRGQRTRIVAAGNPPTTAEGEWVIRRWGAWLDGQHPHPAQPGELRWYARVDGKEVEVESGATFVHNGETVTPKSRTFVPARLGDNPYLVANNYGATLQALPEPLRSQLLYGDFAIGLDDDPWQVIPTAWVRAAMARHKERQQPPVAPVIGVDVARGGADKTVIARRFANWYAPLLRYAGQSTPNATAAGQLVLQVMSPGCTVNVDVIGVGASVFDWLVERVEPAWATVAPVNVASASSATDRSGLLRFANLRAEAYWRMREALDPDHGEDLALPEDSELLADLCAPRWEYTPRGIRIEEKDDIIKRIGRSPDAGDAAVLALIERRFLSGGELGRLLDSMGQ